MESIKGLKGKWGDVHVCNEWNSKFPFVGLNKKIFSSNSGSRVYSERTTVGIYQARFSARIYDVIRRKLTKLMQTVVITKNSIELY